MFLILTQINAKKTSKNLNLLTLCLFVSTADNNFANSLDSDLTRQNIGPDLHLVCLTLLWYS